jgi:hypothetical protein
MSGLSSVSLYLSFQGSFDSRECFGRIVALFLTTPRTSTDHKNPEIWSTLVRILALVKNPSQCGTMGVGRNSQTSLVSTLPVWD